MAKGRIKHLFPGGNTSVGFYSYYHHLSGPEAVRIFILKGGPGVGKSTFMRRIGEEMSGRGYDLEHHHCSSDNGSLDGLVIPAIGVALLDGTKPHIVDPVYPGAVDEIVNLGEHWDENKLRAAKADIVSTTRRISRLFSIAYSHLAEAKVIRDEMEGYVTECMRFGGVNKLTAELVQDILGQTRGQSETEPRDRHLFGSAITPEGVVHHLESQLAGVERLFLIKGTPGSGRSTLVETVARAAHQKGLDTEVYHCAFEPLKTDMVVIPKVRTAVLKDVEEVGFQPQHGSGMRIITYNLDAYLDRPALEHYAAGMMSARSRFGAALRRAVRYIGDAKLMHDYLESFYVPAMDFAAIDRKRQQITKRILEYADEAEQLRIRRLVKG